MVHIPDNTFAAACYNDCSIAAMVAALAGPVDLTDCHAWDLTEDEWRDGLELALAAKREDLTARHNSE